MILFHFTDVLSSGIYQAIAYLLKPARKAVAAPGIAGGRERGGGAA